MIGSFNTKKLIVLLVCLFVFTGCTSNESTDLFYNTPSQKSVKNLDSKSEVNNNNDVSKKVAVKYRDDLVDVGGSNFEYLDTSKSSFVRGAYYDEKNQYMVIKLNTTYYHYCGLPASTWDSFKMANSFGTFYNQNIKGRFSCQDKKVPEYN